MRSPVKLSSRPRSSRPFAALTLLGVALTVGSGVAQGTSTPDPATASSEVAASLVERWGVEVVSLHLSAGGYLVDFRYRVLDPRKAAPLFDRSLHPRLVDLASGRTLIVPNPPKVGALRTTRPPQPGRTYFMLFGNPAGFVKSGNKVAVVAGDFRADNLVVE